MRRVLDVFVLFCHSSLWNTLHVDLAMITQNPFDVVLFGLGCATALLVAQSLYQYGRLRHIPGPFSAGWTNALRTYWVWTRRAHETHIEMHEEYGKLVKCGPNMISVGNAAEVDKIYKMRDPLKKVCLSD
jgi:hypothetical protein